MSADRNLLFGILALQLDFITRDQLIAGMQAWVHDKTRSLGQLLEAAGALDAANRQLLEPLVAKHIQQHAGDPQQSLAAVRAGHWVTRDLRGIKDVDLQASLPVVGRANASEADEVFATLSAGQPTSDGLRFRVLRKYREGGLGIVSVAQDSELDREVALKEMKPHYADDPSGRIRFVREAEITGGLEHPNIVPVYGLGVHHDGRPFYAMRLIRGDTSLADEIKAFHAASKNPYSADQNLRLRGLLQRFIAVCDAIEYAHSRGVLHRDLKPANIMLGKFGETLVVDWGLAKLLQREGDPDQTLNAGQEPVLKSRSSNPTDATQIGTALGTPQYMAPEQAEGHHDRLSPATDVYGLGATLYALLTGQAPVDGKSSDEVLTQVRKGATVPARTRLRTIPAPLAAICDKALAREPANRYSSAQDLAADIGAYLADEPVAAYREPLSVRAGRWARKHPKVVSGGLASALVAILGLLIGFVVVGQKNQELSAANIRETELRVRAEQGEKREMDLRIRAEASEQKAQETAAVATAVRDFLLDDLLQLAAAKEQADAGVRVDPNLKVRTLLVRGRDLLDLGKLEDQPHARAELRGLLETGIGAVDPDLTVKESVLNAAATMQGRFRDQPRIEADVRESLGASLIGIGEFTLAATQFLRVRTLHTAHLGPEHPETLRSLSNLGLTYNAAGRLAEALPLLEEVLRIRKKQFGPEHRETLTAMQNLAAAYADAGRRAEALQLYEQTVQLMTTQLGPRDLLTLHATGNLATIYLYSGRVTEALPLLEKVLEIKQLLLGTEHPDTAGVMNSLALAYHAADRLNEALPLYVKNYEIMTAQLGPDHPHTLTAMNNVAGVYADAKRLPEALLLYEKCLQLRREKLGPKHPETIQSLGNLANTYREVGRLTEALPLHEKALELRKEKLGLEHPDTLTSMADLAKTYRTVGRLEETVPLLEETLRLRKVKLGPEHPHTGNAMNALGLAYVETKSPDKAVPLHTEFLRLTTARRGAEHPYTIGAMNNLASTLLAAGRFEEAPLLYEEALRLRTATLGRDAPDTLQAMINLATAYLFAGRQAEALSLFEEAVEGRTKKLGAAHPETLDATIRLGIFLATAADEKLRDPPRAVELARRAVARAPQSALFRSALGTARYRTGDWRGAVVELELALQLPHHIENFGAYPGFFLAMAKWQLGEKEEAREWLAKSVKWMEQGFPNDPELKRFRTEAEALIGE